MVLSLLFLSLFFVVVDDANVDAEADDVGCEVVVNVPDDTLLFTQVVDVRRDVEEEGTIDAGEGVAGEDCGGGGVGARKGSKKADCNPIAFHCKSLSLHESTLPLLS